MTTQVTLQTNVKQTNSSTFVRNVLKANAVFSSLSGGAFLVAAKPMAAFLGLSIPAILIITGILLLIFAADVFYLATRKTVNPKGVVAVIVADALWVIGSVILLVTGLVPLTVEGKWAVGIVAVMVAVLADLQYYGLRQMKADK
ncbi:hypothetical protein ACFLXQ_02555 [Chloroflexota bacterium]